MKVVQFGCGMVGSVIARDFAKDSSVTVIDADEHKLKVLKAQVPSINVVCAAISDDELVVPYLEEADVVTSAVPGSMGFDVMKKALAAGKSICDISSIPSTTDFSFLDRFGKEKNVFVMPEIGIAPGMTNFLAGRGTAQLDEVEDISIFVGGMPEKPVPPFSYQATWSPEEVIGEYVIPARIVEGGETREVQAMSGLRHIEFEGLGTLEAFYTDGLGTLDKTLDAKNMAEFTLRWPGHADKINLLRDMGLLDDKPRVIGGVEINPRKTVSEFLFPLWKMDPEQGDRDITVFRVVVRGFKGDAEVVHTWDLLDRFDEEEWVSSMGKCTAYTCSIFARAAQKGLIGEKGLIPPEKLGYSDELYEFVMAEQARRGLCFRHEVTSRRECRFSSPEI